MQKLPRKLHVVLEHENDSEMNNEKLKMKEGRLFGLHLEEKMRDERKKGLKVL